MIQLLIALISFNLYAMNTPEELWQSNDNQHILMLGSTYEDFNIDQFEQNTNVSGEFSSKTKIYTFDYEYGLTDNYSVGLGATYVDSLTKFTNTNGLNERDRITGLNGISLNLKGRHFFSNVHGVHFGLRSQFSIANKVRDEVSTDSYESNASLGRHIFTPYLAYAFNQKNWLIGLKLEQEIALKKTTEFESGGTLTSEQDSKGDQASSATVFIERDLGDQNWAGLSFKYSTFSDFKFESNDVYDPSARADHFLVQLYGNIKLTSHLELIPKVYYIRFKDDDEADASNPNTIEKLSGGSSAYILQLRYLF